jgi:tetratricopeptide (TPR) repeat protein
LAIGAGVFVANSAGQRLPGETITGAIEQSTANILATARQLNFTDPAKSIELYTMVLKLEPDNTEALTYRAWMLALSSREADVSVKQLALATAVADLIRAQNADPSYPDAHCFLGIIYFRFLEQASLAKKQLDVCVEMNPPASVTSFVNAIVKEVDAAVKRGQ